MHAGWRTVGSKVRGTRWPHKLMMRRRWTPWRHGWTAHVRRWRSWTHHARRRRPVLSKGKGWAGGHVRWARGTRTTRRLSPDGRSRWGSTIRGGIWHTGAAGTNTIELADWRRLKVVGWWRSTVIRGHGSTIWHGGWSTAHWRWSGRPTAARRNGNGWKSSHAGRWKWRSTRAGSRRSRVTGRAAHITGTTTALGPGGRPTRNQLGWTSTRCVGWTWWRSVKWAGEARGARSWHSRSRGRRGSGRRAEGRRVIYRWPTRAGPWARSEVSLPARDGLF